MSRNMTFKKRQKEQARRDHQIEKAARKQQRRAEADRAAEAPATEAPASGVTETPTPQDPPS